MSIKLGLIGGGANLRILACAMAMGLIAGCAELDPELNLLPGIHFDQQTGEVELEGRVCIEQGFLEYVAVADGGKEYESIFALSCRPSHLQMAMLLAGCQAGEVDPQLRGDFKPQTDPAVDLQPEGPSPTSPPEDYFATAGAEPTKLNIDLEVQQEDGAWTRHPIEHFLKDRATGRPPPRLTWAFTGSFFLRDQQSGLEYFVADEDKSLIALWYDPTALFNLARNVGNPYRGDDLGLEVDSDRLPGKNTPVRLYLRPVAEAGRH